MSGLLVSVRDVEEAIIALEAAAALVDIKEPRRGSLGAADDGVIRAICSHVAGRVPVSVALGELVERSVREVPGTWGARYAKVGLAGCARIPDWQSRLCKLIGCFNPSVTPIAVVYADWYCAMAPNPTQVLEHAVALGCGGLLVDTFDKARGSLLDRMSFHQLQDLVMRCRQSGLSVVLAGSLSHRTIPKVLPLGPDYIAVRGAACAEGRNGRIDRDRVRRLVDLIQSHPRGRHAARDERWNTPEPKPLD